MHCRFLLMATVLVMTACSSETVVDQSGKQDGTSAKVASTVAKTSELAKSPAESTPSSESNKLLASLTAQFEIDQSRWIEESARIKDSKKRQDHFKFRPCLKYADQLVELAEKFPDTEAAIQAYTIATKFGIGESKTKAAKALLASAIEEADPKQSMETLEYLMKYAFGDTQKEAMELMLSRAMQGDDSKSSFAIIRKIVCSPRGMVIANDHFLPNGNEVVRAKALEQIDKIIEADIESETAVECLALVFENGAGELKNSAFVRLLKHHPAHSKTGEIVLGLAQLVTTESENWIKQAVENSNEVARIKGVVALSRFYSQKHRYAKHYESAPPIELQYMSKERLAFYKSEVASATMTRLEETLSAYIEAASGGDSGLMEIAKNELFVLRNLTIGKLAPEIVGQDLDGVEFKLSDYRGKVVLVDFWGDW